MAKIVREETAQQSMDKEFIRKTLQEYRNSKDLLEGIQKRMDSYKESLVDILVTYGQPDEKGHLWVEFEDVEIKRERRVSRSFNASAAEAWAKENGHWDTVKEVIEVVNEDKILGLAWNNDELQETIKTFYAEKETWALKV
jgi:Cu2+-containing amine oxidase